MKRRVIPFLTVWIILVSVLPIYTLAFGGIVAIKGENVFHSVYCDTLEGCKLDDLRWFDTSDAAAKAGLVGCTSCSDYAEWDYDPDGYVPWWITDDPLLLSALEIENDIGSEYGYENGYEYGFSDGKASADTHYECIEPSYIDNQTDAYNIGFDEGFSIGKERGYDEGYDVGFEEGRQSEETGMFEVLIAIAAIGSIGFYCGKISKKIDLEDDTKKNKQEIYRLRSALKHRQESIYILDSIAEKVGRPLDTLVDDLFVNVQKARGYTEEEAKELLLAKKSEFSEES